LVASVEKMRIEMHTKYPSTLEQAFSQAEMAMRAAIEIIDEMFERGYAEEHPEMVVAFLTFAGHAYEVRAKVDSIH
jgi:hypothetical protein